MARSCLRGWELTLGIIAAGLNPLTECSNNTYPDIIEKVAFDPGWGHYEAFAIQRWFTDEVAATGAPFLPAGAVSPGWQEKTNFATPGRKT
jgi:hypothetical protein